MANRETGSDMRLAPGTLLTGTLYTYRLVRVLGQGGFGITYEAEEVNHHQRLALKEYFPMWAAVRTDDQQVTPKPYQEADYQKGLDRFSGEARMLASFDPLPSVVQVKDCFQSNGTAYLVMEYLDGVPLHEKAKQMGGRIPPSELLPKLPPLLRDLEELHQAGVLHRDIAPDNIMWMPDGTLKLLDFGSARRMEGNQELTVITKPRFAPVEQYTTRGQGPYTDVYAMCATIYFLLTGKVPPQSTERLEEDPLQPPTALGVALTPLEEAALLHGLAVQPKDRIQSMYDLLREMRLEDPRPTQHTPPTPPTPPDPTTHGSTGGQYKDLTDPGPTVWNPSDPYPPAPEPKPKPSLGVRILMGVIAAIIVYLILWLTGL
ncbi:MAG: serine/threonine protein kinase [Clostridiales bacterium]|nr:serine/threonine protein kinase [Clostridiales bacterium]